jgi:signal peptidase I
MLAASRMAGFAATFLLAVLAALSVATATGWMHLTPVLSGSMRPAFDPGDALLTQRVPVSSLRVGDVIEFVVSAKYGGGLKVHRIEELQQVGSTVVVHTRGDANGADDPWRASLSGHAYRMRAVLPYAGWIVDFKAANGYLWLLVAVLLLSLASAVQPLLARRQRRRQLHVSPSTS